MMPITRAADAPIATSRPAILAALALGAFLVFLSGLAQAEALHNAAHDVRHATGFPCH